MSEKNEQNPDEQNENPYVFQWDYSVWNQHEAEHLKKNRRRSVLTFALGMAAMLLICIALIVGAVLIDQPNNYNVNVQTGTTKTEQIAMVLSPQTVLITVDVDGSVFYGTGFFIRENGYIATNFHVIDGADYIEVTLYGGVVKKATLVGASRNDDLAVIKVSGTGYPTVKVGDSDTVRTGATAIAIGHPQGSQYPWTVTQGIISFPRRTVLLSDNYEIVEIEMMQFDTPVNSGNSGGPLCNDRGEVIGVVTRKHASLEGIAMALPINGAMEILNAIIETGSADSVVSKISKSRPLLGITGASVKVGDPYYDQNQEYFAERDGVLILGISETGAAINDVKVGDILTSFNGLPITSMEDLTNVLYTCKPGQTVTLGLWRNGEDVTVTVTFEQRK